MKRLLALVVAVGMVVAAFAVRARLDDDGDGGDRRDGGSSVPDGRLVCVPELAAACNALGGQVEPTDVTFDRLVAGDEEAGLDAWLTLDPLTEVVDALRERAGLEPVFREEPPLVATTPLAAVGAEDGCDWRCLGDGDLTFGIPAVDSATGLLVVGGATAGFFGTPDVATNDFTPEFDRWIVDFLRPRRVDENPVLTLLLARAFFDVALTLGAEAEDDLATAAPERREGLDVTYPAPVVQAFAVLAQRAGAPAVDVRTAAGEALLDVGWSRPGDAPPGPSGLPPAGVLIALRDRL